MDIKQLKDFAINAQAMIDAGAAEDRIRHYFSSRLLSIFPNYPWWVNAHMQGTEEYVHFSSRQGDRGGFVDAVVGKTAIEYEKNLTIDSIFQEGYHQVKEYTAALHNIGIPEKEILGVLSDTVRWHGYRVHIVNMVSDGQLLGPENIELEPIMSVDLSAGTKEQFSRFEQFINQFMARERSRILNASTLVIDFGVESSFYRKNIGIFSTMVYKAMEDKPDYSKLIKQLWQNFIAYLGASDYGIFSERNYVNEFYLVTVAKLICANILKGTAVVHSDDEIKSIIDGDFFAMQNIHNFIDYDYFGWLNNTHYIDAIIPCLEEMQEMLCAYDFSHIPDQDIFGKLLAQLANKEHRLMLGQEFTPHWIAREIIDSNLEKITEEDPHIMDMCCGSGVFLIEAIRAIREKYEISAKYYSKRKDAIIFTSVMGFDIDPLAVMLAKVNWVMSMRDLFRLHTGDIIVPIYHADSLFVATPITHRFQEDGEEYYTLTLNHEPIRIPAYLLSPNHRNLFDAFVAKVYKIAMMRAAQSETDDMGETADKLIEAVERECDTRLEDQERNELSSTANKLIASLESLQRQGRNGIWHFIISNSYRPGLTEKQFNCVVSNPPWMAMSKLADNPYKDALKKIARKYSIQPLGPSHPHMELATIFLISSVDRYLKDGAYWSFIMPASIMSGFNHEAFRKEKYRSSDISVDTHVSEIWELPLDTFKNKAIVLSGRKASNVAESIVGRVYESNGKYHSCIYTLNKQGKRSAWTNRGRDVDVADVIAEESIAFVQGCDLFPRTALFHNFIQLQNGNWNIRPIERTDTLWYLISDNKRKICEDIVADDFNDNFIYDSFISKHLSPFFMSKPEKTLIPGYKEHGIWNPLYPTDLALLNTSTASVFKRISESIHQDIASFLENTINIYGKLYKQNFSNGTFLVLSSASGSNPCAAYIDLRNVQRERLVIDQTLYWHLASTEDEAVYFSGLINSNALWEAIADFQPEGGFGKRHIHTLPYKIIPAFDITDDAQQAVVKATKFLIAEWNEVCAMEEFSKLLNPNAGSLSSRRKKQQNKIRELRAYQEYALACACILG